MIRTPYLGFIEINPTELCNYQCSFCPRSADYPNKNLHMTRETFDLIVESSLEWIEKTGTGIRFSITGRGEPALAKNYEYMLDRVVQVYRENKKFLPMVNTNGTEFEKYLEYYKQLYLLLYNFYYKKTWEEYTETKERFGDHKNFIMNWRHEDKEQPSLYYNNRAGSIENSLTDRDPETNYCHKPFSNLFIDWNGDYNLCCNDWYYKEVLGNIHDQSIYNYYFRNSNLRFYKSMLMNNERNFQPCLTCNAKCNKDFLNEFKRYC